MCTSSIGKIIRRSIFIIVIMIGALTEYVSAQQTDTITPPPKNKPVATYKLAGTEITVWQNKYEGKNGPFIKRTYKVVKNYEKNGVWKTSSYFDMEELVALRKLLDEVIEAEKNK